MVVENINHSSIVKGETHSAQNGMSLENNNVVNPRQKTAIYSPKPTMVSPKGLQRTPTASNQTNSPLVGFLYSFSNNSNGTYWPLRAGRISIGSLPSNDIVLTNGGISGIHAKLAIRSTADETRLYIRDQESMNGTQVNGQEIFNEQPNLFNNDTIQIGPVTLHLLLIDERNKPQ